MLPQSLMTAKSPVLPRLQRGCRSFAYWFVGEKPCRTLPSERESGHCGFGVNSCSSPSFLLLETLQVLMDSALVLVAPVDVLCVQDHRYAPAHGRLRELPGSSPLPDELVLLLRHMRMPWAKVMSFVGSSSALE